MAILWLASFPKSGNTWLRAFLANYFANQPEPLSLEAVHGFGFSDAQAWPYREITGGRSPVEMTEEEIAALRPRAHELLAEASADHVMVKTHNANGNADGIPIITPALTLGAIYVLRNPWDVAVSYADHYGLTLDQTIEAFNAPDLKSAATVNQVPQYFSSWSGHLSSWQAAASIPLLTIHYEDMVHKPHEIFGKVTHFLGLPPDGARLDRAIRFSSFKELSGQEDKTGFVEKSRHSLKFFRKGEIGGWRDVMSDEQAKRIADNHAPALQAHGYLTASGDIREGRGN